MKYYDAFSEAGYHSAFLTTYALSVEAFEDVVLPRLRGSGCRNIHLLADQTMANIELADFATPRFAGTSYHLVKVKAPSAFHPKIVLQLGHKRGRLMIGSANLTGPGLAGNLELVATLTCEGAEDPLAPLFAAVIGYLRECVPSSDPWFFRGLDRALSRTPWLRGVTPSPIVENSDGEVFGFLSDQTDSTILDQFAELVEGDAVQRLIVASPFWDRRLEALSRLREALDPPKVGLLLEKDRGEFPTDRLGELKQTSLYDMSAFADERSVHAKLFVAEGVEHDHILSGSPNCSAPALLGQTGQSGNAEAALYRRIPAGQAVHVLQLESVLAERLAADALAPFTRPEVSNGDVARPIDGGTLIRNSRGITWLLPENRREDNLELKLFDGDGLALPPVKAQGDAKTGRLSVELNDESDVPRFGRARFGEGTESAPILVSDVRVLPLNAAPPKSGRAKQWSAALGELGGEDLIVIEALNDLEELERTELTVGSDTGRVIAARPEEKETYEGYQLSYEAFTRGANGDAHMSGRDRSLGERQINDVREALNRFIGLLRTTLADGEDDTILGATDDISSREPQEDETIDESEPRATERAGLFSATIEGGEALDVVRPRKALTRDQTALRAQLVEVVRGYEARQLTPHLEADATADAVRLRATLQILIAHAMPLHAAPRPNEILPKYAVEANDWPRLIARVLVACIENGHCALSDPARLASGEDINDAFVEAFGAASWCVRAALVASTEDERASKITQKLRDLRKRIDRLVEEVLPLETDLRATYESFLKRFDDRFTRLLDAPPSSMIAAQ